MKLIDQNFKFLQEFYSIAKTDGFTRRSTKKRGCLGLLRHPQLAGTDGFTRRKNKPKWLNAVW